MHELVTVAAFDRALLVAAGVWLVGSLVVVGLRRKAGGGAAGFLWAALGPLAFGLWKYYQWTVRVVPETGYVGLHKVSVFAIDALVFIAVGCLVGYLTGRLHNNGGKPEG